jgi:hypothetical protein
VISLEVKTKCYPLVRVVLNGNAKDNGRRLTAMNGLEEDP